MLRSFSLGGINGPVKRLMTSAGRCQNKYSSCVVNNNVHLYPGGQQQEKYKPTHEVLARRHLTHFQSKKFLNIFKFITSTLGQTCRIQENDNDTLSSVDAQKDTVALIGITDYNLRVVPCLELPVAQNLNETKKVSNLPSLWNWLPSYKQKVRLLDRLFSYGSQDILTCLNRNLGPLSISCRGFHLEPARHCNIPTDFQYFFLQDQKYGTTYASQLCMESQNRLKEIAHERLKKILRANKIKLNKNVPNKYPEEGLFKSPLLLQLKQDKRFKKAEFRVPAILRYMVMEIHKRNLDSPGLFRVSGDPDRVTKLKSELEQKFYTEEIDSSSYDIYDFATLLKDYLRDLPAKLISTEKFEIFPDIQDLDFDTQQYPIMNIFHLAMTVEHRQTLQYLLSFLAEVSRHSGKNQMDADKLAMVFGPLLFKMAEMPPSDMAEKVSHQVNMARAWMFHYVKLALVPEDIMEELRKSFNSKPITVTFDPKLFPVPPQPPTVPKNVQSLTDTMITVLTPYEEHFRKDVAIDAKHTAQHVVCEALRIPFNTVDLVPSSDKTAPLNPIPLYVVNREMGQGDAKPIQCLHELGGNIGERCLHPYTKILELYKKNPKAFWVVKSPGTPSVHKPPRKVTFNLKL